jgi:hypothetical protein
LEPRGGGNRFLGPPSPATRFHRSPLRPRCLDCNASSDYGARVSAARGSTHWGYLARCHRRNPLPPDSAEALLGALLGSDPALRPLKHVLIERTEGNPFFLEESVRTLVETRALAGERGAYGLALALPSIQVPTTVQAILAARIDRLAVEEKRLLQAPRS